ncbi:hypothetical protein ANN_12520 [Periplaneta americana]|uniref:Uncharacterized protein n=1 Tax=Periplaneta americana TaxID=6978 RepID=A0ABQ8TJ22_PERAM|nr:hypothetical protein ANN_12520 [Periplaneta americana]
MLGENLQMIRENTRILLEASKEIGLEVNPEKTNMDALVSRWNKCLYKHGDYVNCLKTNLNITSDSKKAPLKRQLVQEIRGLGGQF